MNIYWYSPSPHVNESRLARELLRPEDQLTVQSFATRFGQPIMDEPASYVAVRDLPEALSSDGRSRVVWAASRARAYARRARLRHRLVRAGDFDLCHVRILNYFTDGFALRGLHRHTAVVSTVHDVVPHESRLPAPIEDRALRSLYAQAGHIVVAHRHLERRLVEEFGVSPDRVSVVPLPLELDPWVEDQGAVAERSTALLFGSLRPNKGLDVLLDAARILHARGVACRVHVAGHGPAGMEAMAQAAAEELPNVTAEVGYVSPARRAALFRQARVVVLPYTRFASQSGVLRDAYAFGVPAVVSEVGALGESVRADGTGWVVPPSDADELARVLEESFERSDEWCERQRAVCRVAVAQTYDVVGRQLRDLYERVVS